MKHDHVFDGRPSLALASRCDRVVCVSRAMAAQFEPRLGNRVRVAYPAWRCPARRTPCPKARTWYRSAGSTRKGVVELLEAAALPVDRGLDVRVTLAGPENRVFPAHAGELREFATRLELAERAWIGWVDDLDGLYATASVVALASRARPGGAPSEGASTVLMEGMSHGRSVVAPREAGIAEVVGDAGALVDARTDEGFATALEPYLRDRGLSEGAGRRGRGRTERLLSLEHACALARMHPAPVAERPGPRCRTRASRPASFIHRSQSS